MIKAGILIVIVFALILVGPLLTIWSLNTLFPALAIPYAIETWAAVIILAASLRANVTVKGKE
jgi:hypothetical protein